MLCDNCGENEATVRYTEIINGHKREMMLCEECSKKLGINNIDLKLPIDFSSFFGDLISEYEQSDFLPMFEMDNDLRCKTCNLSYKEFLNTGKLGCPDCYDTFKDRINTVLNRIQGSTEYQGRKSLPSGKKSTFTSHKKEEKQMQKKNEVDDLEEKLKLAIKDERYEDAAKIRDKIKKIQGK